MLIKPIYTAGAAAVILALSGCKPAEVSVEAQVTTDEEIEQNENKTDDGITPELEIPDESTNETHESSDSESSDSESSDSEDSDVEDSDVEDSDVEDSDVEDSDVEDSDVEDSDVEDSDVEDSDVEDSDVDISEGEDNQEETHQIILNPFDIYEIKPESPRTDGLGLEFTWDNENSEHSGVNYRICVEDLSKDDFCHELASTEDTTNALVRLDRIYPHTTTNFFVIASLGEKSISTNPFQYNHELFLAQAEPIQNAPHIVSLIKPFDRSNPHGNVSYETEKVSVEEVTVFGRPRELTTELKVTKNKQTGSSLVVESLPNLDIDLLKSLNPTHLSDIRGIYNISRAVSDEIIKVTLAYEFNGHVQSKSKIAYISYNGAGYEWITDHLEGELEVTGAAFAIDPSNNGLMQVSVNGSAITEVKKYEERYITYTEGFTVYTGDNRDTIDTSNVLITSEGEKFTFWHSNTIGDNGTERVFNLVKLSKDGSTVVDSLRFSSTPTQYVFDKKTERLYIGHSRGKTDEGKIAADFELSSYQITGSGFNLIDSVKIYDFPANLLTTGIGLISPDGKSYVWNTYSMHSFAGYKFSEHAMSVVYHINEDGTFVTSPDIVMGSQSVRDTGEFKSNMYSLMSHDLKAYAFKFDGQTYLIGDSSRFKG